MNSNSDIFNVPEPCLRRLPWYLSRLNILKREGCTHVSSTRLGKDLHMDASVIAKDLSYINIKGKTRIGYDVESLEQTLRDFLGYDKIHRGVVVGVGSLGEALIRDHGLINYGLDIVAGFDIRDDIICNSINSTPVYSLESLNQECERLKAEIGIITVPAKAADTIMELLINAGIKAIWNFTPGRLKAPDCNVVVQNTSIYAPLAIMYNRLREVPSN